MNDVEEIAKKRFMTLIFVRFIGVVSAFAGIANLGGKLLPDVAPYLGYALLLNGIADVMIIPVILKNKWRSGSE